MVLSLSPAIHYPSHKAHYQAIRRQESLLTDSPLPSLNLSFYYHRPVSPRHINACLAKIYAHSIEEDRKSIAQKFDDAFYGEAGFEQKKDSISSSSQKNPTVNNSNIDITTLVTLIQSNPELAKALQTAMANSD